MKAIVGFGFFLLFLAGIALVMLQGREMARQNLPAGGTGITGIDWRPVIIGADAVPADSGLFVQFSVDGSIKGHAGCNDFFGSLEKSGDTLAIGELGMTRKACAPAVMDTEQAFIAALQDVAGFETGTDRLQLLGEGNRLLAELVPATSSR